MYSQVQYEFKSSSDVLETARPQAEMVIELGKRTTNDVGQLRKDIDALINKMKGLKDKISDFTSLFLLCLLLTIYNVRLAKQ